jgi:hypothetical protein
MSPWLVVLALFVGTAESKSVAERFRGWAAEHALTDSEAGFVSGLFAE